MFEQEAHSLNVTGLRGSQQRCRTDREHQIGATIRPHGAIRRKQLQLRIRIGSGIQQNLNHLRAGRVIQRRPVGAAAMRNGVEIDGFVQRRAAPPVPGVDIRFAADEVGAHIEVKVTHGHDERSHPFRIGEIRVGVMIEQQLHALQTSLASGIQQRSQSAHFALLGARLGGYHARPVIQERARIGPRTVI
jgi:hypothetical protein